ncbi:hypothetical protein EDB81DRAFT_375363 [Dactylonectria macrodidyma]|uniref:F-box domain-containing protein n=1 Tax=Dactylonectria macrodidyma TaxID=307937 RepID=A0A9P9CZ67_9HYPO|nr:hypothetical protein EDB81DRAFT_375363 [Dactylonectria macrodidyma]
MMKLIDLPPELHRIIWDYLLDPDLFALIQTSKFIRSIFEPVLHKRRAQPSDLLKTLKEHNSDQEQRLQSVDLPCDLPYDLPCDLPDLPWKKRYHIFAFDCVSSQRAKRLVANISRLGIFCYHYQSFEIGRITTVVLILQRTMDGDLTIQRNVMETLQRLTKTLFLGQLVEANSDSWVHKHKAILQGMQCRISPFHLDRPRIRKVPPTARRKPVRLFGSPESEAFYGLMVSSMPQTTASPSPPTNILPGPFTCQTQQPSTG